MDGMVSLAIGILLVVAVYLLSARSIRNKRCTPMDAERSVAMTSPSKPTTNPRSYTAGKPTLSELHTSPFEADRRAAEAQLQNEFALAVASSDTNAGGVKTVGALDDVAEPILYVNPKQYHRILKRRISRQAVEESLRIRKRDVVGRKLSLRYPKVANGLMMAVA